MRRWETVATLAAAVFAGVVGVVMVVAYLLVRPMRRASATERGRVEKCRESKKRTAASKQIMAKARDRSSAEPRASG